VPCHRVVRADGNLAGYAWGLERKRLLLKRERDGVEVGQAGMLSAVDEYSSRR
jgi:AraC family transcriptional regulator, regulatory protein of adaptative response / methylated-DNA-[protein]-cysteine methyltransferase